MRVFGNKKLRVGIIAVMIGVAMLATSLSYAWWSGSGGSSIPIVITFDTIGVAVDDSIFSSPDFQTKWKAGTSQDGLICTVKNTGNMPTCVKFTFTVDVNFVDPSDTRDPGDITFGIMEGGFVNPINTNPLTKLEAHPLGLWIDDTVAGTAFYLWQKDAAGNYYVWMYGDSELHFAVEFAIDKFLDVKYAGATVDLAFDYEYTQADPDDAFIALWGFNPLTGLIDLPGFVWYDSLSTDTAWGTPFSLLDPIAAAINDANAMADGAFKTAVIRILEAQL